MRKKTIAPQIESERRLCGHCHKWTTHTLIARDRKPTKRGSRYGWLIVAVWKCNACRKLKEVRLWLPDERQLTLPL